MNINYETPTILTITKMFNGTTPDGRTFTITAGWDEWDDWNVDSIEWDEEEGSPEETQEIEETFLNEIN